MIKAIFAVDHWGGMGLNGSLPWPHHSEDLQYFKEQTQGHIVVMGRRTWDDPKMPKPLPDRQTYVATSSTVVGHKNVKTIRGDLCDQIKKIAKDNPSKTVWILGGPQLLLDTRDITDQAHVTHFKGQFRTDVQLDMRKYFLMFQATGAAPSSDRKCNWTTYKNIDIFRQL
jgi:dihydrofolate reductase